MSLTNYSGPKPSPKFKKYLAENKLSPMMAAISGEISTTRKGVPIGITVEPCYVANVHLSALKCGKDDSSVPKCEVDILIDGVSCLTTKPAIAHVSGEADQFKTTIATAADTGITDAVIDATANTCSAGSVISYDLNYTGNASPTTKARDVVIIVEFQPIR